MKRKLTAIILASAAISYGSALAQQVTWKVAIFGPPRALTVPIEHMANAAAANTGGQLKIEPVYGEALSKALEIIDNLKAGAFEAGFICASYYPGKLPLYTVLDLPMLTPADISVQARLQKALVEHAAIAQELKRWNMRMLLPGPLPQYQMMGKRRIAKVEDLKGVRIRASGEMARVLEDHGAIKSLVPAPEAYVSLERGVLDMITLPATYAFQVLRMALRSFRVNILRYTAPRRNDCKCQKMSQVVPLVAPLLTTRAKSLARGSGQSPRETLK